MWPEDDAYSGADECDGYREEGRERQVGKGSTPRIIMSALAQEGPCEKGWMPHV